MTSALRQDYDGYDDEREEDEDGGKYKSISLLLENLAKVRARWSIVHQEGYYMTKCGTVFKCGALAAKVLHDKNCEQCRERGR